MSGPLYARDVTARSVSFNGWLASVFENDDVGCLEENSGRETCYLSHPCSSSRAGRSIYRSDWRTLTSRVYVSRNTESK